MSRTTVQCTVLLILVTSALTARTVDLTVRQPTPEQTARAYLRTHPVAGIEDEESQLVLHEVRSSGKRTVVSFRQALNGVEVLDTEVQVTIDANGILEVGHVDTVVRTTLVSLEPKITAVEALDLAAKDLGVALTKRSLATLYVLRKNYFDNDRDTLAWFVDAVYRDAGRHRDAQAGIWVDAISGAVIQRQKAPDPPKESDGGESAVTIAATALSGGSQAYPLHWGAVEPQTMLWHEATNPIFGAEILTAGPSSAPYTLQDPCHGIGSSNPCFCNLHKTTQCSVYTGYPTFPAGDSYFDDGAAKAVVLATAKLVTDPACPCAAATFGDFGSRPASAATQGGDVWATMRLTRQFVWDLLELDSVLENDARMDYYVNSPDASQVGGASFNLYPLPPKIPTKFSVTSNQGGTLPNGFTSTSGTSLDVIGHEIGHALQFRYYLHDHLSSNTNMVLAEAQADMFASCLSLKTASDGYVSAGNPWWIGDRQIFENYSATGEFMPSAAIRFMDQPSLDAWYDGTGLLHASPDCYDAFTMPADVHAAAGPYNHMFYILAQGDLTSACNKNVGYTGIGYQSALRLWFQVIKTSAYADSYAQIRKRWTDAASALYGSSSPEIIAVNSACDAVLIP